MTFTFKLSRRIAGFRAPLVGALLLGLAGCGSSDSFDPDSSTSPAAGDPGGVALAAAARAGGIPIGTFGQPNSAFGAQLNGALRIIWPEYLLSNLAEIKARGGRVLLDLAGGQDQWRDASGHFSMTMWKAKIDRYKGVNFSSYIDDGTIIGHYLIDEPNDPTNWNGTMVSQATVEEMAKYSKQLWPGMATVVRAEPGYMNQWSGSYRYLDAAWAQYVSRKGTPDAYLSRNVADAQKKGLALIVGLNVTKGNNDSKLTPSQVESWGASMLNSTYPCAFLSWEYSSDLLSSGPMRDAMTFLRGKAENLSNKSCRNSSGAPAPPPPPSPPPPPPEPTPTPVPPPSTRASSLPFGLFNTPMEAYSARWSGTVYNADPAYVVSRLDRAQGAGMNVIVVLAGTAASKNTDGTFSLTKWKAQVDRFRGLPLAQYVSSKTFYLHDLIDQPSCASCWGGKVIPWETVEEMARYSKSIWPTLPTASWVAPSKLAAAKFRWTYLDAGWIQYNTAYGDLPTYLAKEVSQARLEGLGLVVGLNLRHGSGVNSASMTASQIKEFGTILASDSSACALVAYRHDSSYLGQSGVGEALDSVAAVAKRRTAASCVVS